MSAIPRTRIALLSAMMIVVGAGAGERVRADEVPQWSVRVTDLAVNTDAGIQQLYSRIRIASARVCDASNPHATATSPALEECKRAAVSRAVMSVGIAALTSYHARQTGQATLLAHR